MRAIEMAFEEYNASPDIAWSRMKRESLCEEQSNDRELYIHSIVIWLRYEKRKKLREEGETVLAVSSEVHTA